jgi:hypothetical protein
VDSKAALNHVYGVIAKIPIPFHLPVDDGCSLGVKCPIKNGSSLTESVTLPVLSEYPSVIVHFFVVIVSSKFKLILCYGYFLYLKKLDLSLCEMGGHR